MDHKGDCQTCILAAFTILTDLDLPECVTIVSYELND